VPVSRYRLRDALREAITNVARSPLRTLLTSLGALLAVGTVVVILGLGDSAAGAVSGAFNQLRATTVTFSEQGTGKPAITEASEQALDRLHGVIDAGLVWTLNDGALYDVSRLGPLYHTAGASSTLQVVMVSARGLRTVGAAVANGRLFDTGMDASHQPVALLGSEAASGLGITSVAGSPAIYIAGQRFTVIGIVRAAPLEPATLAGIIVPVGAAIDLPDHGGGSRQLIVHTQSGAAQLIASQGPDAIDPYNPSRISAAAPIDPSQLRNQVSSQLTTLLLVIALVTMLVGVVSIANVTLLSVIQRRAEIGLRRSIGAAPHHIALMIVSETTLVGVIGGVIGTSGGVLITALVCALKGWAPAIEPTITLAAPLAGALSGLLAGAYPAWRASSVTPISALQR